MKVSYNPAKSGKGLRTGTSSSMCAGRETLIPVWASVCRLTIASLLMGGCGLSHEYVEGGCKDTCVKFGG